MKKIRFASASQPVLFLSRRTRRTPHAQPKIRILTLLTVITVLAGTFLLPSCQSAPEKTATKSGSTDFLQEFLDTTTRPADNFYQYAVGGWIKNNPLPPGESEWGVGSQVQEDIYTQLRAINEAAALSKSNPGTVKEQIGNFWFSAMDTASIESLKLRPIQPCLDSIDHIRNIRDLLAVISYLHSIGQRNLVFADDVMQDDKNSGRMALEMQQCLLGMPGRDYYFNTDKQSVAVRKAYRQYLYETFRLLGKDSAAATREAKDLYQLETRLATASRNLVALRNPEDNYRKINLTQLAALCPSVDWPWYLRLCGFNLANLDSLVMRHPGFYQALNIELTHTPIRIWKDYLFFHFMDISAPFLDSKTYFTRFRFMQVLDGVSAPRPRWKRMIDHQEGAMGEALGRLFVKEYFSAKARERYIGLVKEIRSSFRERIEKLEWMSDSTRRRAIAKLDAVRVKVGYPDKWLDFSNLHIDRGPFVLNMEKAGKWWRDRKVSQLGKPANRDEWLMSPQTFNAYYTETNNEVVFPAGIFMVPGIKDEDLDDAFVYGYAAAGTIGHEITHGFDDEGRKYDENGNLANWWLPADEKKFDRRASFIVRQFNEFVPVDTLHINGEATQGENIADLGGLVIGLTAFKKSKAYARNNLIGGLTPIQRFFLGYAFSWAYEQSPESIANDLMTDVHATPRERVNGPLVNIPEFYQAFNIRPGDKMYRPDSLRVSIW